MKASGGHESGQLERKESGSWELLMIAQCVS